MQPEINESNNMKLSELNNGESAYIVKVTGHGGFRKRILEMGFVKGQVVSALQTAPMSDPVKYSVMGYEVSLRKSEASMIEVVSEAQAREMLNSHATAETIVEEDYPIGNLLGKAHLVGNHDHRHSLTRKVFHNF